MKRIFTILVAVLITATVWAQAPQKMSYQSVVRDASNNLTTNQAVGMQISILQDSVNGTAVYVERQFPTTNANGLVSIEIGIGTVVSGNFTAIDWANGPYFIKTETDLNGGSNYTITGTSQLLSVPYALHANFADSVTLTAGDGIDVNGITISEHKYQVGDFAQGGVVFWVDETGEHGLVCSITDLDTSAIRFYAGTYTNTLAFGDGVYAGEMNTQLIISSQGIGDGAPYAALLCISYNVTYNGVKYGGWYLPSNEELMLMYNNRTIINSTAVANGGTEFLLETYWTSNEESDQYGWKINFANGNLTHHKKFYENHVRAIRRF